MTEGAETRFGKKGRRTNKKSEKSLFPTYLYYHKTGKKKSLVFRDERAY